MMSRTLIPLVALALSANSLGALASGLDDARSVALGGSVIANGKGVMGAMQNPASLAAMQRSGDTGHAYLGFSLDTRLPEGSNDVINDEKDGSLIDDLQDEFDSLDSRTITCDPFTATDSTVCLNQLDNFNALTERMLRVLDVVDEEDVAASASFGIGGAVTGKRLPVAVHLGVRATSTGTSEIADGDRAYIDEFLQITDDGILTWGEVQNTSFVEDNGNTLNVVQPTDVLTSNAEGAAMTRTQLSIAFARSFTMNGRQVDVGVTPKLSSLTASSAMATLGEEFDSGGQSLQDRLDNSEVGDNSFTFDIGASTTLDSHPLTMAAVVRNIVKEEIETLDGYRFETTPQLIVGGYYDFGAVGINADLALNAATVDGLETQTVALGLETEGRIFAFRAGINMDSKRAHQKTALTLGAGIGPLQFSARVSDVEAIQAAAQLAWSF